MSKFILVVDFGVGGEVRPRPGLCGEGHCLFCYSQRKSHTHPYSSCLDSGLWSPLPMNKARNCQTQAAAMEGSSSVTRMRKNNVSSGSLSAIIPLFRMSPLPAVGPLRPAGWVSMSAESPVSFFLSYLPVFVIFEQCDSSAERKTKSLER